MRMDLGLRGVKGVEGREVYFLRGSVVWGFFYIFRSINI